MGKTAKNHDFMVQFGENLYKRRKELGLTQEAAADLIEVSWTQYRGYENATKGTTIHTMLKIADKFGVPLEYLIAGKGADRSDQKVKLLLYFYEKLTQKEQDMLLKMLDIFVQEKNNESSI